MLFSYVHMKGMTIVYQDTTKRIYHLEILAS